MVSQKVRVRNKSGLHMRPASELSKVASSCKSEVTLVSGEKSVNPKSILMLMSAGIKCGTEIEIRCDGETEKEDLANLINAIEEGFGEEMID